MSMRSVMPGMLRRSSLVRMGPSERRHRMVPFQRPSTTESMASMGHSETSFFETGMGLLRVLTTLSVRLRESVRALPESDVSGGENGDGPGCCDDVMHWIADWDGVRGFGVHQPGFAEAGGWGAGAGDSFVCAAAGDGDAVLVCGVFIAADCGCGSAAAGVGRGVVDCCLRDLGGGDSGDHIGAGADQ